MPFVQGGRITPVTQPDAGRTAKNIGATLTGVGKLMEELQVQRDDQKTKQATVAYLNDLNAREAEFKAKAGTNAIDAYPEYQKSIEELNSKYAGTLENDVQRGMFSQYSTKYGGAAVTSGATHVYKQQRNVNIASSQSIAALSANSATKYGVEGDHVRAADALKLSNQNLQDAGRLAGKSQAEIDLDIRKSTSGVLINTAAGYLSQHKLQSGSAYLEKQHKAGALIEEDYINMKKRFKDAIDSHNGGVDALATFNQAGGDYEKAFSLAANLGGERAVKAQNMLLSLRNTSENVAKAVAEEHAKKLVTLWDQQREYERTGNSMVIDPNLLGQLSTDEQTMIAAGPAKFNTSAAETEIMQALRTGGSAWATFQATRLPLLRGQLTEESYASFAKLSNPSEVAQASVNEDMLRNALNVAGYKGLKDNDAKRYRIRKTVDDRIVSAQMAKGRPLTEPEKSAEITKVLSVVIEDDAYGWTWGDSSKKGPDVAIEDIPEIEVDALRTALTNAGKLTGEKGYDDQAIVDTWLKLKGR